NEYAYSKVFFERWYRPDYTTVIVAGDVTPAAVVPLVEKYWGGWKPSQTPPPPIPKDPAPHGPLYAHVPWATATLPSFSVSFPAPSFDQRGKDFAAMDMIASIYFGQTSDLYKKLVVTEQKVDQLDADLSTSFAPSMFSIIARVKNAADAVYV